MTNRARNTTSTAAARAVGPGRKLRLPRAVETNANGEGDAGPLGPGRSASARVVHAETTGCAAPVPRGPQAP
jgi:hypothetical protein